MSNIPAIPTLSRLLSAAILAGGLSAPLAAADYAVDPDHAAALFVAGHFGVSHVYGMFTEVKGTFAIESDAAKDAFDITVTASTLFTHQEKRDQHLKGPDFFDVTQFPTLTFKSTAVAKVDEKVLSVSGNLTIHGVTKPITVMVAKTGEGEVFKSQRIGYESTFEIKRGDFGMTALPGGVGEDVKIIIAVEGIKK
jgi:polyisoprenoid-binding protein YceI